MLFTLSENEPRESRVRYSIFLATAIGVGRGAEPPGAFADGPEPSATWGGVPVEPPPSKRWEEVSATTATATTRAAEMTAEGARTRRLRQPVERARPSRN